MQLHIIKIAFVLFHTVFQSHNCNQLLPFVVCIKIVFRLFAKTFIYYFGNMESSSIKFANLTRLSFSKKSQQNYESQTG